MKVSARGIDALQAGALPARLHLVVGDPVGTGPVPRLTPGQQGPAQVAAALPGQRFEVIFGGATFDMGLPAATAAGDTLQLTYLGAHPRPTFIITQTPAPVPPAAASFASVSEAARLIAALAGADAEAAPAARVSQSAPLVAGPPDDPAPLAAALQRAVSHSGLFYEAHQLQWLNGTRTLAELRREPQNRRIAYTPPPGEAPLPAAGAGLPADAPELARLVRQQLDLLEAPRFAWRGEAWPGQSLEWEIGEDGGRETPADESRHPWRSRITLTLPRLGTIEAVLHIAGGGVALSLRAREDTTAGELDAARPALSRALAGAGLRLLGAITVERQG